MKYISAYLAAFILLGTSYDDVIQQALESNNPCGEYRSCSCRKPSGELCEEQDFKDLQYCSEDQLCPEGEKCFPGLCEVDDPSCEMMVVCEYYLLNEDSREGGLCWRSIVCKDAEYEDGYACYSNYQCENKYCNNSLRICENEEGQELGRIGDECEVGADCEFPHTCYYDICTQAIPVGERCNPNDLEKRCFRGSGCLCTAPIGTLCKASDYRCRPIVFCSTCISPEDYTFMFGDLPLPVLFGESVLINHTVPGCEITVERVSGNDYARINARCFKLDLPPGYACGNLSPEFYTNLCASRKCDWDGTCE